MKVPGIVWIVVLLLIAAGCGDPQRSPSGFRLPESGDVEQGRVAFEELRCYLCHKVAGEEFPPTVEAPAPVVLGGKVSEYRTDGYLVTSIIHPSWRVDPQSEARMVDLSNEMTVRQLVDLIAFLQSRYELSTPPMYP